MVKIDASGDAYLTLEEFEEYMKQQNTVKSKRGRPRKNKVGRPKKVK